MSMSWVRCAAAADAYAGSHASSDSDSGSPATAARP